MGGQAVRLYGYRPPRSGAAEITPLAEDYAMLTTDQLRDLVDSWMIHMEAENLARNTRHSYRVSVDQYLDRSCSRR